MANVDAAILAMIAECLESELCGSRIGPKHLDEENDELSEIAAVASAISCNKTYKQQTRH